MTDDLLYKLNIKVENGASIEAVEEQLEQVLLDLYDIDSVEGIIVKDRTPPIDEDVREVSDVISDIESKEIMQSIKLIETLGGLNDE